jgi:hypothetical protein
MKQTDEEQLKRVLGHLKQHFDGEEMIKVASA